MATFKHFTGLNNTNQAITITIAAGPVIIENNKVLLDKHGTDGYWKFPGGALFDNLSPKEHTRLQAQAELGVELELTSEPFVISFTTSRDGQTEYIVLIHYLAKRLNQEIKPGPEIKEWAWYDIKNLPPDCAPNIKLATEHFQSVSQ